MEPKKRRGADIKEAFDLFEQGLEIAAVAKRLRIPFKKANDMHLLFLEHRSPKPEQLSPEMNEVIFKKIILPEVQRLVAITNDLMGFLVVDWAGKYVYFVNQEDSEGHGQLLSICRKRLLTGI